MLPLNTVLYHGTIDTISHIDVTKGRDRKDFGKGFYLAVSKSQAIGMMHKKFREQTVRNRNHNISFSEHLYEVRLNEEFLNTLNIKVFEHADEEWIDFILLNREKGGIQHSYDLVVGPSADDNTILCLRTYWDGYYGKVGSEEAKEVLLRNLEVENLGIQYFIGKQEIADKLILSINEISWS